MQPGKSRHGSTFTCESSHALLLLPLASIACSHFRFTKFCTLPIPVFVPRGYAKDPLPEKSASI